jgi:cytosine/adenosine deaminase-related metal-dependent hydrolase
MPRPDPLNSHASVRTASMLLRARAVLPLSRPPIEDGAIFIVGNRIRAVGRWKDLSRQRSGGVLDLGEVMILPGLVNAHCHLDYTAMAGELRPTKKFTDWLKLITTCKSGLTYSDFAESWLSGAKMLVRTGTTTVGDIEMVPELLPEVWTATPLRVFSFLELTGVKSRRPPREIIREALAVIKALPKGRCRTGLSPHAPYSTAPELLRLAANTGRRRRLRVVTHVAESDQEFEMFTHGRGEMFEWLARSQRDMSDCGLGTPVQHLERQGALNENLLAVHVNYLGPGDAALLGRRKVNVVHCPRSHAYFKHQPFPFDELASARVNICLGTDSLASVYQARKRAVELNLFDEMRELADRMPSLSPEKILHTATRNGARALGMPGEIGELSRNALADLIAIPHAGKVDEVYAQAVQHRGNVTASMIDGQWVIAPS